MASVQWRSANRGIRSGAGTTKSRAAVQASVARPSCKAPLTRRAGDRRCFRSRNWSSACARSRRTPQQAAHPHRLLPPNRICARRSAWRSTTPTPPTWRTKPAKALKASKPNQPAIWKALRAQGIFRGHGPAPKVAFLYTGQGSQYVNMLQPLRAAEPIVAETFAEADRVMTPLLGKPLSEFIFVDKADPRRRRQGRRRSAPDRDHPARRADHRSRSDPAVGRLRHPARHDDGPQPGRIRRAGCRRRLCPSQTRSKRSAPAAAEMTQVAIADNGTMAAVFAPLAEVERILKTINGYVVIANINSDHQAVIGGASKAVEQAMQAFQNAGYNVVPLPVSHAFHTSIVAPASEPLREVLSAPAPALAARAGRRQRERRVLSHRARRCAADARHSRPAGRFAGAVCEGAAHAVRGRRARLRRSRTEESVAGICRGGARRPRRCSLAVHQSSQSRRHRRLQPGAVRTVCRGLGPRNRGGSLA